MSHSSKILQIFEDPRLYSPKDYGRLITGQNMVIHSHARRKLEEWRIFDAIDAARTESGEEGILRAEILTTGSDGRGEKGPHSPIDIILLVADGMRKSTRFRVEGIIGDRIRADESQERAKTQEPDEETDVDQIIQSTLRTYGLFGEVEVKDIKQGKLRYYQGREENWALWPSRLIDTTVLLSSKSGLRERALTVLADEYLEHGDKILDVEKKRRQNFALTTRGGQQKKIGSNVLRNKTLQHFDVDRGAAYFDPNNNLTSFKHGPLRLVQSSIQLQLAKVLKDTTRPDKTIRILSDCPRRTDNKLVYLHGSKILLGSKRDVLDLAELYEFFLWLYHCSEYAYRIEGVSETTFDSKLVLENLHKIASLEKTIRGSNAREE